MLTINLDENEEEEEEPNKEEIDAKRKIFEKEAKKRNSTRIC